MNILHFRIDQNKVFFLAGIFSTISVLSFLGVTLFSILLFFAASLQIFLKQRITFSIPVFMYVFVIIISCVLSSTYAELDGYWLAANLRSATAFMLTMGLVSTAYENKEKLIVTEFFLKGLYISLCIQLFWGMIQFVCWYFLRLDLNEIIFSDIFHVNLTNSTWTFNYDSSLLRLTGLGWEPAYFSFAMISGFIISKNKIMKILFLLMCLLSTSRTGVILLIVAFFLSFKKSFIISLEKVQKFLEALLLVFIVAVLVFIFSADATSILLKTWNSIVYWQNTTSGGTHFNYINHIPYIVKNISIWQFLFGFGTGSSGYPYSHFFSVEFAKYITAWSVENDYVNALWGTGLLGLISYFIMIVSAVKDTRIKEIKVILICLMVGGVFYIFSGTWVILLAVLQIHNKKKVGDEI